QKRKHLKQCRIIILSRTRIRATGSRRTMPRIVVVGAGISGLATAFRLRQRRPDAAITVLESAPRAGGKIGTETHHGFPVHIGPNGFLDSKPSTLELCPELGIGPELTAA